MILQVITVLCSREEKKDFVVVDVVCIVIIYISS